MILYFITINIIAFVMYGVDKKRAIEGKWRISEKTLIGIAFLGGSLGALGGMQIFHHKTKHWKFKIFIPICLMIHIIVLLMYFN